MKFERILHKPNILEIYTEFRTRRVLVGTLFRDQEGFRFEYERSYLSLQKAISLGPEFPMTTLVHRSNDLFPSLQDRIPSRENPAYREYCTAVGISEKEDDEIVLLGTLGRKGPSSFIFELVAEDGSFVLSQFRNDLQLSIREFSALFDVSFSSVQKIEAGVSSGRDVMKRIEIYARFPQTALFELHRNRRLLHSDTYERLRAHFQER
jgi:hypothetical protein